jgi:hypothetical protein
VALNRRGFMGALGFGAVAGPQMAQEAVSRSQIGVVPTLSGASDFVQPCMPSMEEFFGRYDDRQVRLGQIVSTDWVDGLRSVSADHKSRMKRVLIDKFEQRNTDEWVIQEAIGMFAPKSIKAGLGPRGKRLMAMFKKRVGATS